MKKKKDHGAWTELARWMQNKSCLLLFSLFVISKTCHQSIVGNDTEGN